jgi:hypothetical protein
MKYCKATLDTEDDRGNNAQFQCTLEEGHRGQHISNNCDLYTYHDKTKEGASWTMIWDVDSRGEG